MCILSIWVGGSNAVATAYCGVSVIAPSWIHPCFLSLWYVHRALLIILCFCDCAGTESHPFSIHLFSCCKCKIFNAGLHAPLLFPLKCIRWIPLVSISQLIMKSCADLPTFWWYVWDYKSRHCLLLIFFSGIYKWKLGEINECKRALHLQRGISEVWKPTLSQSLPRTHLLPVSPLAPCPTCPQTAEAMRKTHRW